MNYEKELEAKFGNYSELLFLWRANLMSENIQIQQKIMKGKFDCSGKPKARDPLPSVPPPTTTRRRQRRSCHQFLIQTQPIFFQHCLPKREFVCAFLAWSSIDSITNRFIKQLFMPEYLWSMFNCLGLLCLDDKCCWCSQYLQCFFCFDLLGVRFDILLFENVWMFQYCIGLML